MTVSPFRWEPGHLQAKSRVSDNLWLAWLSKNQEALWETAALGGVGHTGAVLELKARRASGTDRCPRQVFSKYGPGTRSTGNTRHPAERLGRSITVCELPSTTLSQADHLALVHPELSWR